MEWNFRINWQALVDEARSRRKKQKLTQAQLGLMTDISTPTISRFESGETDIQVSNALKILQILGMTDQRTLIFPASAPALDADKSIVIFHGLADTSQVRCAISCEALEDHYGGNNKSQLKVFSANREQIEHEARKKFLNQILERDGTVLIKTEDL